MDFSCVEKVRKLRIPYGTRETRTYHVSNHMGLDHLAASCVRLMISTAISFCMNVLSSESLGAMEEDDDVSTWWNDWGYMGMTRSLSRNALSSRTLTQSTKPALDFRVLSVCSNHLMSRYLVLRSFTTGSRVAGLFSCRLIKFMLLLLKV